MKIRKIEEDDLDELSSSSKTNIEVDNNPETEVTLDELSEAEDQVVKINSDDSTEPNS